MNREETIKGLETLKENIPIIIAYGYGDLERDAVAIVSDALELLKEQEPKPGHWIPVESPTGVEAFGIKEMTVQTVRCSDCGAEEDVSFSAYRFCPRCGKKKILPALRKVDGEIFKRF